MSMFTLFKKQSIPLKLRKHCGRWDGMNKRVKREGERGCKMPFQACHKHKHHCLIEVTQPALGLLKTELLSFNHWSGKDRLTEPYLSFVNYWLWKFSGGRTVFIFPCVPSISPCNSSGKFQTQASQRTLVKLSGWIRKQD